MKTNMGYFLYKRALLTPKREALVVGDARYNYAELNRRSNKAANAMKGLGVGHGDRVGILALNDPEYFELLFGLGKIGAIAVPINHRLAAPEVDYIVNNCEADLLVVGPEFIEVAAQIKDTISVKKILAIMDAPPDWAEKYEDVVGPASDDEPEHVGGDDDTWTILYTSGTTGRPKGAELTHEGFYNNSNTLKSTLGEVGEVMLMVLPLFHIGALAPVALCVHHGMKMVFQRTFEPAGFLHLIKTEDVTWFGSVPQVLMFLRTTQEFETYDWTQIKLALVYAAPVPVTLLKEFAEKGMEVRQLYGMTECTGPATVIDGEHAIVKAGSCGLPFFHTEIRVVDANDQDVGPEEIGEVLISCNHLMKGYWKNPSATESTVYDGWLHSGDLAKKDEDGYLYILDRKKDMIISGGENIYPAEIEDYLLGNPKIADVGVIGYADEKWGEAVKAVVVLKPEETMTEQELIEWCQGKIGKFKIPKKVEFAKEIPRTPTGKILKRILRDQFN